MNPTLDQIGSLARDIAKDMRSRSADIKADHQKIWDASDSLRRALGADKLAAFGWRGEHKPDWKNEPWATCRERLPPEMLRAPVTLTQNGVVPFVAGHDDADEYCLLFCDILIDAEELLEHWPAPEGMADMPRLPAAQRKPSRGCNDEEVITWVRAYAERLNASGKRAKLEGTIQAAAAALGCTTRQARAAFRVLPYPELRDPPRVIASEQHSQR